MRSQIEVQREPFAAAFEGALKRLLAGVHQLVSLQFAGLNERFATLGADVHPWTVRMQVLSHGAIVSKHFGAILVRTGDRSRFVLELAFLLRFRELGQLLRIGQIDARYSALRYFLDARRIVGDIQLSL